MMTQNMLRDYERLKKNDVDFGAKICGADIKLCIPSKSLRTNKINRTSGLGLFLYSNGVTVTIEQFCKDLRKGSLFFRRKFNKGDLEGIKVWVDRWKLQN